VLPPADWWSASWIALAASCRWAWAISMSRWLIVSSDDSANGMWGSSFEPPLFGGTRLGAGGT